MLTSRNTEHYSLPALAGLIRLSTLVPLSVDRTQPLPVLLVIADRGAFGRRKSAQMRHELAVRGLRVVVAVDGIEAASDASPDVRAVTPDVAIGKVSASDYSAMVCIGDRDASQCPDQDAFPRAYRSPAHQRVPIAAGAIVRLIDRFIAQNKPVAAVTHDASALAWTGIDHVSPWHGTASARPASGLPLD